MVLTASPPQAPDWVDAEECHRCRVQFGVMTRKVSSHLGGSVYSPGQTPGPLPCARPPSRLGLSFLVGGSGGECSSHGWQWGVRRGQ